MPKALTNCNLLSHFSEGQGVDNVGKGQLAGCFRMAHVKLLNISQAVVESQLDLSCNLESLVKTKSYSAKIDFALNIALLIIFQCSLNQVYHAR